MNQPAAAAVAATQSLPGSSQVGNSPPAAQPPDSHRRQLTWRHYRVLAFISSLSMITYLDRVCFGVAAPSIASELNLSGVADLKWAFTVFAIAYALFEIPTGWLGDRLGPRATLTRIVLWWSACTALTGLVGWQFAGYTFGGLGTLVLLRFLFGAGEAGAYPNIARTIYNWFPSDRWEMAQGFVWMSGRLMGGLTPFVWMLLVTGTALTPPLVNWRGAFLLFGLVGMIWCLLFRLYFTNRPPADSSANSAGGRLDAAESDSAAAEETVDRDLNGDGAGTGDVISNADGTARTARTDGIGDAARPAGVPWRWLLTNRNLLLVCFAYTFVNYGWAFNITYLPSYLSQRYPGELTPLQLAAYAGAPLWVGAIGCIAGGYWVSWLDRRLGDRRRGRKWACFTAMLGCAVCWGLAWAAVSPLAFSAAVALAAFCVDLTMGATWATSQDIGREHTAVAAGLMNTIGTIGAAIAGWLTGSIVQWAVAGRAAEAVAAGVEFSAAAQHTAALAGFQTVFLTYGLIYLAAAACWLALRPQTQPVPNA